MWMSACIWIALCDPPCHLGSQAAAGCVAGWPWGEVEGQHRPPPLLPPHRSSACLMRTTLTRYHCSAPHYAYAGERQRAGKWWLSASGSETKCSDRVSGPLILTSSSVSSCGVAALSSESFCEPCIVSMFFLVPSRFFLCLWASFLTWPSALPELSRRTGLVSHFLNVFPGRLGPGELWGPSVWLEPGWRASLLDTDKVSKGEGERRKSRFIMILTQGCWLNLWSKFRLKGYLTEKHNTKFKLPISLTLIDSSFNSGNTIQQLIRVINVILCSERFVYITKAGLHSDKGVLYLAIFPSTNSSLFKPHY